MRVLRAALIALLASALLSAADASALVITVNSPQDGGYYNTSSVGASIITDEDALWCGYSLNGTAYQDMSNTSSKEWQTTAGNLDEGDQSIAFQCNDTNQSVFTHPAVQFTTDFTPPAILNIDNGTITYNRSEIIWTTDEQADSGVIYGKKLAELTSSRYDGTFANIHDIYLENLLNKTEYFYYTVSCDRAGNCNQSEIRNFTTPCREDWVYGEWGACVAGYQVRSATDRNMCGTADEKESIYRRCVEEPEEIVEVKARSVTWETVEPNITKRMVINEDGIDVMEISYIPARLSSWNSIRVASLSGKPAGLPDPPGLVSQYVNITTSGINFSEILDAKVLFRASREWITSFGINRSSVKLLRFEGAWKEMNTTMVSYNDMNAFYESEVPGFSVFAIKGDTGTGPVLCTPGETVCEGNVLRECSDWGELLKSTECEFGCSNETLSCNESVQQEEQPVPVQQGGGQQNQAPACAADATRCEGNKVMLCNTLGTGEMVVETCRYGCYEGRCVKPEGSVMLVFFIALVFGLLLMIIRHKHKVKKEREEAERERVEKREARREMAKKKRHGKEPETEESGEQEDEEAGEKEERRTISHF